MIEFVQGDIFESGCEAIVNPINCIGKMGAGLALQFKQKYPEMFKEYEMLCKAKKIKIGSLHFWRNPHNNPKWIINFPTKDDLSPSKLEYIQLGLVPLREAIIKKKLDSVAIPLFEFEFEIVNLIETFFLDFEDETNFLDSCNIKLFRKY